MRHPGNTSSRIWELDFFRGIALILMIYFHMVYDLKELYNLPFSYETGINFFIGKLSAILFILISGISTLFSSSNVRRGVKVFLFALILTVVTHLYNPLFGIKFGILHFLGLSMVLAPLFKKVNKYILLVTGALIIYPGFLIKYINTSLTFLFPIGITSGAFTSSDYYPLIPWFGVFLIGISLGKFLYKEKKSLFGFTVKDNIISTAGQNTLLIYMLHQPVIIGILMLVNLLSGK